MWPAIAAGFMVGLLGSFHCIGMCGPIALALPVHRLGPAHKFFSVLAYNLGRMATYALLGLLFGSIGATLFIGRYQQVFSVAMGVIILLVLILPRLLNGIQGHPWIRKYQGAVQEQLAKLFQGEKHLATLFLIGVLNGLLPCGLVYMAIAGALVAGSLPNSVVFMTAFGLATLPVMLSVTYLGQFISLQLRRQIRRLVPVVIGLMAVLLILRGLNLGIPYISPALEQTRSGTDADCCHKQ